MRLSAGNYKPILGTALVAIVLLAIGFVFEFARKRTQTAHNNLQISNPVSQISNASHPIQKAALLPQFETALRQIQNDHDAIGVREQLRQLRSFLASMAPAAAAEAIRSFLDSGSDVATTLPFKVGPGGFLADSPSLRVFLLDHLEQFDPAAAAAYARKILARADSAEEWAVALRSLARGDTSSDGRSALGQKIRDLLQNSAWQQNPSVGYLEAFDAAVYLGGTNLIPSLGDLVRRQDNPAVAHASYLTLDRLVISDTASLLTALAADPSLMQGREQTRADYFARADVRDARQRQILESYLLDPQRSAAELDQFSGTYPNANYMISQNLLTSTPTPDHASLVSRDAASLRVVREWLADPRFVKLGPQLEKVKSRLEKFSVQASR